MSKVGYKKTFHCILKVGALKHTAELVYELKQQPREKHIKLFLSKNKKTLELFSFFHLLK